jgi:hypothetical protein
VTTATLPFSLLMTGSSSIEIFSSHLGLAGFGCW